MASVQEAIKRLIYRYLVEGADKVVAANQAVAASSEQTTRASLSLEKQFSSLERRFSATLRAQQDYEKVQRQVNAAVAQNPALQARASQVLAQAALHFDQASKGQRAMAVATQAANDNLRSFAQSAGPIGSVLAALGPGGIAAAVGIGAAAVAIHQMVTAATALAERAGKLKDFAETTGFTVIELQALEKAGAQVGVSAESVSRGLERFSVQMADVRLRTGETYDKLLAINPLLARQVAEANSLSKAYELVSKAIRGTDVERANQIARAFFGRSGIEQTRLMRTVADAQGLKGLIADLHEADIITAKQADRWDTLGDKINENMKAAKQNIASIFTEQVLEGMERFSKAFLDFTREVKQFGINEDLKSFIDFFSNKAVQGAIAGAMTGAMVGGPAGAVVGAAAGAIGGQHVANLDAEQTREAVEQLKLLNEHRQKAIEKIEYYKRIAAEPDNLTPDVDLRRAEQAAQVLDRLNEKIRKLSETLKSQPLRIDTVVDKRVEMDAADRAAERAAALERERQAIIGNYNEMARWMAIIGSAATMAERYELATRKLDAALADKKITDEQYTRAIADQKQQLELRLGVANMELVTQERLAQVREVTAKAGLTEEQQRLAVQIAMVEAKERERQAWRRANPEMALALDYAEQLAKSLVAVAMGTGSVSDAFKNLSASMASGAISSLFKGEFLAAGLQTIGAVISGVIGSATDDTAAKELEKAKIAWEQMKDEMRDFIEASKGFDLAPIVSQLRQLESTAQDLWMAAMKANDAASASKIVAAWADSIINSVHKFANVDSGMSETVKQINDLNQQSEQLTKELLRINPAFASLAEEMRVGVGRQIEALKAQLSSGLIADINEAEGRGFVNELNALFDRVHQLRNESAQTGVDTSLIDRFLQVQAQKIVDGAELAGDAFNELLTIFPNLTGVVKESTQAIEKQAEEQRRLRTELDQAAHSIVSYVANLQGGPDSALSPSGRLAAAQATYNATLALAQGNNVDALSRITQDFENLRQAAQAVFGSSTGYQNILNTGIQQLLALPAVATSTDPVVQALLNVQTAVQGTTTAVQNDTAQTVAKLNEAIINLASVITNLSAVIGRIDTSNAILNALQGLQNTASQQLILLNNNLTITGGLVSTTGSEIQLGLINIPGGVTETSNNNLLTALNKIVLNTASIAFNTASLNEANNYSWITGRFAAGGWITGGIPGRDSVPLMAMPNEYMVQASATQRLVRDYGAGIMDTINAGRLPSNVVPFPTQSRANDNVSGEIRQLNSTIERQTQVISTLLQRIEVLEQRNMEATERGTVAQVTTSDKSAQSVRFASRKRVA